MTMSKRQIKKENRQTGKLRNNQIHVLLKVIFLNNSSSSSCNMPLPERRRFHDITPQIMVISSVPGRPQSQVLMFEVVLDGA